MTVEVLNAMDQPSFTNAVGWIFEHSPWVADRAWAVRPFTDIAALHREMVRQVEAASPEEQLALLRAHPDLGTRAELTRASASEQAAFDFDQRFIALNQSYRDKFGFPFLYAVRGVPNTTFFARWNRAFPRTAIQNSPKRSGRFIR